MSLKLFTVIFNGGVVFQCMICCRLSESFLVTGC